MKSSLYLQYGFTGFEGISLLFCTQKLGEDNGSKGREKEGEEETVLENL